MTVTRTTSLLLLFLVPSFILGNPVRDEPEETLLLDSSDDSDYQVLDTSTTLGDQSTTTTAACSILYLIHNTYNHIQFASMHI